MGETPDLNAIAASVTAAIWQPDRDGRDRTQELILAALRKSRDADRRRIAALEAALRRIASDRLRITEMRHIALMALAAGEEPPDLDSPGRALHKVAAKKGIHVRSVRVAEPDAQ